VTLTGLRAASDNSSINVGGKLVTASSSPARLRQARSVVENGVTATVAAKAPNGHDPAPPTDVRGVNVATRTRRANSSTATRRDVGRGTTVTYGYWGGDATNSSIKAGKARDGICHHGTAEEAPSGKKKKKKTKKKTIKKKKQTKIQTKTQK
jgi:hypothetical protein